MFQKVYGGGHQKAHRGCEAPPYEPECCPCEPCSPCEPACPPKTRASDAIIIESHEVERCFSLKSFGCSPKTIYANQHCFMLRIRKRGSCTVITTVEPVRALPEGDVCFSWCNLWDDLGEGYYEADLFTDGKNCNTLLFKVRHCDIMVHSTTPIINEACPIDPAPCCGTNPQLDDEPPVETGCADECAVCED